MAIFMTVMDITKIMPIIIMNITWVIIVWFKKHEKTKEISDGHHHQYTKKESIKNKERDLKDENETNRLNHEEMEKEVEK